MNKFINNLEDSDYFITYRQMGDGCDYMIDCGVTYRQMSPKEMYDDVLSEMSDRTSHTDLEMKKILEISINNIEDLIIHYIGWYNKIDEIFYCKYEDVKEIPRNNITSNNHDMEVIISKFDEEKNKQKQAESERKEYERLKIKFEG